MPSSLSPRRHNPANTNPKSVIGPQAQREMAALFEDPVRMSQLVFGHDLWPIQQQILRSVATNRWTSVKACHSSGKTFTAADAALWWITKNPNGIAVTTAPTWMQVEKLIWGEIRNTVASCKRILAYPQPNRTELQIGPNRYAVGISTNDGVRFQGWHGTILIILDEAPGVLPEIYESIEGIRAGGDVRILELGNPVIASGHFYESFTANRNNRALFTISAFDTPNLHGLSLTYPGIDGEPVTVGSGRDLLTLSEEELDQNSRPYLTSRRWVKEKYEEWSVDSPLFQARVLGNFPMQSDDALISLAWLEQARNRIFPEDPSGDVFYGIDVAGPGEDETVLVRRVGNTVTKLKAFSTPDPRGAVLRELAEDMRVHRLKADSVRVDSAGIGYGFALHLEDHGIPVKRINVGKAPTDLRDEHFVPYADLYDNLKAQLCWGLRLRLQRGEFAGLADDRAIAQLTSIRYSHNSRGKVQIESKEDARKRGVKSPDRAEAIMLCFADLPVREPRIRRL
jgi:hypothetical protein